MTKSIFRRITAGVMIFVFVSVLAFAAEAAKQGWDERRQEYNGWIGRQAKKYHKLYIGS